MIINTNDGVTLADLGGLKMVKVWENASTTSDFLPQKISFEKDSKDIVLIEYIKYLWETTKKSLMIQSGSGILDCTRQIQQGTEPAYHYERAFDVSNSGIDFGSCGMKANNTFYGNQNTCCVPIRIFVIKGVQ